MYNTREAGRNSLCFVPMIQSPMASGPFTRYLGVAVSAFFLGDPLLGHSRQQISSAGAGNRQCSGQYRCLPAPSAVLPLIARMPSRQGTTVLGLRTSKTT